MQFSGKMAVPELLLELVVECQCSYDKFTENKWF